MTNTIHPVIENTIRFVQSTLQNAEAGHDWWHIKRVWQCSLKIADTENCDHFIVSLAALLHDIADSKFHNGDEAIGPKTADSFLRTQTVSEELITRVTDIIKHISYKGGISKLPDPSIELQIVQDADRLDAMGAIGIARAFNYGGFTNRSLFDPQILPQKHLNKEGYQKSQAPTINHFYEKLLKLKDLMNTKMGKELAEKRHDFMQSFLKEFFEEAGEIEFKTI